MVFLGIVLIILCLLLFGASNNINKMDSELKEEAEKTIARREEKKSGTGKRKSAKKSKT